MMKRASGSPLLHTGSLVRGLLGRAALAASMVVAALAVAGCTDDRRAGRPPASESRETGLGSAVRSRGLTVRLVEAVSVDPSAEFRSMSFLAPRSSPVDESLGLRLTLLLSNDSTSDVHFEQGDYQGISASASSGALGQFGGMVSGISGPGFLDPPDWGLPPGGSVLFSPTLGVRGVVGPIDISYPVFGAEEPIRFRLAWPRPLSPGSPSRPALLGQYVRRPPLEIAVVGAVPETSLRVFPSDVGTLPVGGASAVGDTAERGSTRARVRLQIRNASDSTLTLSPAAAGSISATAASGGVVPAYECAHGRLLRDGGSLLLPPYRHLTISFLFGLDGVKGPVNVSYAPGEGSPVTFRLDWPMRAPESVDDTAAD